jgi:hypothetical protein
MPTPAAPIQAQHQSAGPDLHGAEAVAPCTPVPAWHRPVRIATLCGIGIYALIRLRNPLWWDLLDNVSLVIHEAGHVLFMFFGDHLHALGGSLLQVIIPVLFAVHFFRRRQPFAGAVTLAWVGQNLCGVATYVADARAQALPLLGGENVIHDWWYLLTEWRLLEHDQQIARLIRFLAATSFIASLLLGARHLRAIR